MATALVSQIMTLPTLPRRSQTTLANIYGVAICELEFYLVNRLANEVFIGKEVDYTCVNAEDEKFLTLEVLDKINVIIQ